MKKLRKTAAFARTSQESSANNSSDNAKKFIYDVNQAAQNKDKEVVKIVSTPVNTKNSYLLNVTKP